MVHIQVVCWLVQHHHVGVLREASGQQCPAALTTGELVAGPIGNVGESHHGYGFRHDFLFLTATHLPRFQVRQAA